VVSVNADRPGDGRRSRPGWWGITRHRQDIRGRNRGADAVVATVDADRGCNSWPLDT